MVEDRLKKAFAPLNTASKQCLKFGVSLSLLMLCASYICRLLFLQQPQTWLYLDLSMELARVSIECLAAVVIPSFFWDVALKGQR